MGAGVQNPGGKKKDGSGTAGLEPVSSAGGGRGSFDDQGGAG